MDLFDYAKYENESSRLRSASILIFSITKASKKRTDSSFFVRVVRVSNLLSSKKIEIFAKPEHFKKKLSQTSLSTWHFLNSVFQDPVLGS